MKYSCPIPQTGSDTITLGHGSGGLLTQKLLQSGVFRLLNNEMLDQQHDGASFSINGRTAFSTDSYVISPVFFPGGNIGELAVNGTVNDLSMCGAMPRYLSLSFIIEEGLSMAEFRAILEGVKAAAERSGVSIVTGDTKVVEKGKGDKIFINTSGIGSIHPAAMIHHNRIQQGDRLIISGNIAAHGMAIMSVREGLEFETDITSDTTNLNHTVAGLLDRFGGSIHFLRDPTRGGLASVLNEVAGCTEHGYYIEEAKIPVDEQVDAACEMLGLDPLYVANEGVFLAVVAPEIAAEFSELLQADPNGKNATIIGEVTGDHPGKVIMKSRIGGSRVVGYLAGEQLPRIC